VDTRQFTVAKTPGTVPPLTVKIDEEGSPSREFQFTKPFVIGRDPKCDIVLTDKQVSKVHLEVYIEKQQWSLRDMESTNGTFKDGKKVQRTVLTGKTKLTLGPLGPLVTFVVPGLESMEETRPITDSDVAGYVEHLINEKPSEAVGARTQMLRRALQTVQKKNTRKYLYVIGAISVIAIGSAIYAYLKHQEVEKQKDLARAVFYELKELELGQAALERRFSSLSDSLLQTEMAGYKRQQKALSERYERFVKELGVYGDNMSVRERTIYRVARMFGECEINVPPDFVDEVSRYIDLWKTSPKLSRAVQRAVDNGYAKTIRETLEKFDMPPQYFYLALKESDFDSTICGPQTRFGIAKGVWQFIPTTASQYGLRTGPLVDIARHDPRDERHNVRKSTLAAAKYIRDIYNTEAQASGLLVVASYNWGHNAVRSLIRKMPENPRERNFWAFLTLYRDKLPKETYDYVMYIYAATVIGEDPPAFGFKFPKPL
jgi:hypothetical protein